MRHEGKEEFPMIEGRERKIGGKIFHRVSNEKMSKAGAEAYARHLRNRGYHVRVIKEKNEREWLIYARKVK
jgi:hypothetical protein